MGGLIGEFADWGSHAWSVGPILDERSYVKKHYIAWCWQRGIVAAQTIEEFLTQVEEQRIPQPETITVKLNGKYWQVMDAKFNWRKTA